MLAAQGCWWRGDGLASALLQQLRQQLALQLVLVLLGVRWCVAGLGMRGAAR